uniref:Uncharacterized protein n=1 Tax=Cyanistes caeruleus TaxID=156563 RepID=A0A8C0UM33_CYACU
YPQCCLNPSCNSLWPGAKPCCSGQGCPGIPAAPQQRGTFQRKEKSPSLQPGGNGLLPMVTQAVVGQNYWAAPAPWEP